MQVMVKISDGASSASKDSLTQAMDTNPAIKIQDKKDISNELAKMLPPLMLNMLYGLLAMAVIVASPRVVINTLAMSVFERSQEIGMLRAIGLDRKGIGRMVRLGLW